jgi:hypothetical protein
MSKPIKAIHLSLEIYQQFRDYFNASKGSGVFFYLFEDDGLFTGVNIAEAVESLEQVFNGLVEVSRVFTEQEKCLANILKQLTHSQVLKLWSKTQYK